MSQLPPAVTIRDVAAAAQVGITTVSRALNNQSGISPATRARILQVAQDLHYQPNRHAQNLRSQNINNIAVVMKGPSNPFFLSLIDPLEKAIRAHGYQMSLLRVPHEADEVNIGRGAYQDSEAAGVLFLGGEARESTAIFNNFPLPFTLCTVPPAPAWDNSVAAVSVDEAHGISLIISHLTGLGHHRIAFLGPDQSERSVGAIREKAFVSALNAQGITAEEKLIVRGGDGDDPYSFSYGYQMATRLLARKIPFTAVVAISDVIALGAQKALIDAGLKIPEDVSITGFDGIEFSRYTNPALTTVEQPIEQLAETSCRLLFAQINKEPLESPQRLLRGSLLIGDSTGPAPTD
ncbi:MAG: LacI family DNA-binding transcriptional regulator [Varibaculum cambriense]|uniref:LacI family DNA-binding transcriptional regulator n=1 Tax=Varibaculum cambriense TaxID=184870 RepID=UPI0028FDFA34|nr:LacI family DNA-binding transcriptional regulator [Varibaculum cambriense]MDU1050839.1 LacI family DNA-binding transcriptional regulator [Varibaculum cambriense]